MVIAEALNQSTVVEIQPLTELTTPQTPAVPEKPHSTKAVFNKLKRHFGFNPSHVKHFAPAKMQNSPEPRDIGGNMTGTAILFEQAVKRGHRSGTSGYVRPRMWIFISGP